MKKILLFMTLVGMQQSTHCMSDEWKNFIDNLWYAHGPAAGMLRLYVGSFIGILGGGAIATPFIRAIDRNKRSELLLKKLELADNPFSELEKMIEQGAQPSSDEYRLVRWVLGKYQDYSSKNNELKVPAHTLLSRCIEQEANKPQLWCVLRDYTYLPEMHVELFDIFLQHGQTLRSNQPKNYLEFLTTFKENALKNAKTEDHKKTIEQQAQKSETYAVECRRLNTLERRWFH